MENKLFTTPSQKVAITNIASRLFESIIQTHVIHLQNPGKTFAQHAAMSDFYSGMEGFVDDLVEKSFIKVGTITGYKTIMIGDNIEPVKYLQGLLTFIETQRKAVTEPYLNQIIDNIIDLIASTLYKLITQPS